ncbi:MAG: YigZ family protein [Clostridiales bacterium]|jgi:uncharacterized YigZ family protein|nr:YigZ family protein [Clostridiales bacterium]
MITSFITVKGFSEAEIIEKKSRFIASAAPVSSEEEALLFVEKIKNAQKGANHNCYAYRVGLGTVFERRSDDGEPSGTAGSPMLDVLKKENVTNTVVVVTRYFGGTLLGAGGLVRAYSSACAAGIKKSGIITRNLMQNMELTADYALSGKLKYEIAERGYEIYDIAYGADVTYKLRVPFEVAEAAREFFVSLASGNILIEKLEAEFI